MNTKSWKTKCFTPVSYYPHVHNRYSSLMHDNGAGTCHCETTRGNASSAFNKVCPSYTFNHRDRKHVKKTGNGAELHTRLQVSRRHRHAGAAASNLFRFMFNMVSFAFIESFGLVTQSWCVFFGLSLIVTVYWCCLSLLFLFSCLRNDELERVSYSLL